MSRAALVVLAHGSRDSRSAATVREIAVITKRLGSELTVAPAFLDHTGPDLGHVVDRLADGDHRDIVVVPLLFNAAYHARVDCPAAVAQVQERHRGIRLRRAPTSSAADRRCCRPLDQRLSEALASARCPAPQALVLASAGTSDPESKAAVLALANQWAERRRLPVSVAFASTTTPTADEAVRRWTRSGFRRVAVGSLFIAPGTLPDRVQALAFRAGAIAVSAPIGAHVHLCRAILDRYRVGAGRSDALV